ncbi:MAG: response regulator [Nitrososphaeraceae archaeon]
MKILIAEDEPEIWKPYKVALEARGHKVVISEDGQECLRKYNTELLKQKKIKTKSSSTAITSSLKKETAVRSLNQQKSPLLLPPPFDAVILDYRMPKKDGLEAAKEILELDPRQRIVFASAYVKETLEDSVKQLKQVVELMQKPFEADTLADTIEDKAAYEVLKTLIVNIKEFDLENPTKEQISRLFEGLRKIQKGRTF